MAPPPAAAAAAVAAISPVILNGFFSSSTSFLARFCLNLKGVQYKYEPLPLKKLPDGRPDASGERPTLSIGDVKVQHTGAIFNLINETWEKPPLLPADEAGRARVRSLATYVACEIYPFGYYRVDRYLSDQLKCSPDQIKKWHRYWLEGGLKEVENMLAAGGAGKFCHGDQPSMADVFLLPQVHYAQSRSVSLDLAPFRKVKAIYEHALELPAFQKALPENQVDYQQWK